MPVFADADKIFPNPELEPKSKSPASLPGFWFISCDDLKQRNEAVHDLRDKAGLLRFARNDGSERP
ncbi:MAG: hypothetical protein ACTHNN_17030 [Xanthobacteraceae bacterium]